MSARHVVRTPVEKIRDEHVIAALSDGCSLLHIDRHLLHGGTSRQFDVELYDVDSPHQGIAHVIAPERGITLPGSTLVCGDSHTATNGGLGALAFGIGTTEVIHVRAAQALLQRRPSGVRRSWMGWTKST